jgi:hypothetical protein
VALARLEVEQLARAGIDRLVGGIDPHGAVDDDEHSRLPHLMLAERLAGAQLDEDDALGSVAGVDDDGRPHPVRRLDLIEFPVAHE